MKQLLLKIANDIFDAQGTITTLEVKNRARLEKAGDPNFRLGQDETSKILNELSQEEGWNYTTDQLNGNTFRVYTRGSVATAIASTGTTATPASVPAPSGNVPSPSNGGTIVYLSGKPQIWFQTFTAAGSAAKSEANVAFRNAGHLFVWNDLNPCDVGYFTKKYGSQL